MKVPRAKEEYSIDLQVPYMIMPSIVDIIYFHSQYVEELRTRTTIKELFFIQRNILFLRHLFSYQSNL